MLRKTTTDVDRERIIKSYLNRSSVVNISRVMALNKTTVHEIIKKYQITGKVVADKRGGLKYTKLNEEQKREIKKMD